MTTAPHTRPLGTFPLRGVVPYITAWSSEREQDSPLVDRRGRLSYADEHPLDRDDFGILWRRVGISPGLGKPEFGVVHSLRQRRSMLRLLCQVCGGPADETRDGVLWLMGRAEYERDPWPAPIESPHPPVCLNCAGQAIRLCPHLRGHYVAVRAVRFRLSGIHGARYVPTVMGPRVIDAESYAIGSSEAAWVKASQLIMRLIEYQVVDFDIEYGKRPRIPHT
jgi:hypothetical protein